MKLLSERGFEIVFGDAPAAGEFRHKFGGFPEGLGESDAPQCAICKHPFECLLQIDLSDPTVTPADLDLPMLWVLNCLRCDACWSPVYYRVGQSARDLVVVDQEKNGTCDYDDPGVLEEKSVSLRPLSRPWTELEEKKHQLYGSPLWIQGEESCPCLECGGEMVFFAQIDSDDDLGIMFGDMGTLYAFICPECHLVATYMQCF